MGPAWEILRQVEEFKATAHQGVQGSAPLRLSATAYAPSGLLAHLETVPAGLPGPTEFSVPGSGTEVAAKLIGGQAELGLIHLPASDKRLRHKVVASYQGAVAVRFDDPLAAKDLVTIDELRDREVAIDFARPNPVVLAGLTRRLNSRGVHRIVRTTNQRGGELELATQVFNRHLVALVSYAPDSFIGRCSPQQSSGWCRSTKRIGPQRESYWPGSPNDYRAGSPRSSRPSGRSPTGSGRYGEAPDLNRYPSVEAQAGAPSHPPIPSSSGAITAGHSGVPRRA